jgi:CRP/FNR family transcriptional regulator, nitrogen fixation regulation protein
MMTKAFLQSSFSQFTRFMHDEWSPGVVAGGGSVSPKVATIRFSRNTEIYREGDPAAQLYKVISGTVRTCRFLADGRRQIGAFYLPGEIFGLETEERHLFSAEAVIESEVLIIEPTIVPFGRWNFEVTCQVWALMRDELKRARDRVLLLGRTAQERVAGFLLAMAERMRSTDQIELPMSRQDIADYLGLTLETVSRMLSQLESESAIAVLDSKRIVLRKRAALRRLAA